MPKISALGGMSSRGFGEFAQQTAANYIEDVFSTYLYTGNAAVTTTVNNSIDLAGKGGMVWIKARSNAIDHIIKDTSRSFSSTLFPNLTNAAAGTAGGSFLSNGFDLSNGATYCNATNYTYASWTFRKQPKFFDVVTYTGDGTTGRVINHNLGSSPGMIVFKNYSGTSQWPVWHRSLSANNIMFLNLTDASTTASGYVSSVSSTTFTINANVNTNGATFVAYLFAHDAGGFGADGSQNVISCGSFTNASGAVTLGYEPQFILYKLTSTADSWNIIDTMRGMDVSANTKNLYPNTSGAEASGFGPYPTATGFQVAGVPTGTYIYMAIRRGPMRTPTSGTSVLSVKTYSATTSSASVTHDVVIDLEINKNRAVSAPYLWVDRLRGLGGVALQSSSTGSEVAFPTYWSPRNQTEMYAPSAYDEWWASSSGTNSHSSIAFLRAPGFFDVVCSSSFVNGTPLNHNLGVVPELIISKARNDGAGNWMGAYKDGASVKNISLNVTTGAYDPSQTWSSLFTSTTFDPNGIKNAAGGGVKGSASSTVSYLFATCPGVSKVGSYTGTGATQTISCGFTGGARYVLIKRTDSTGDWWVWDTARGMVAGTDPRLAYNSTAAETNANWVYTTTGGFQIVTSDATVNASGGSYIFLAIA